MATNTVHRDHAAWYARPAARAWRDAPGPGPEAAYAFHRQLPGYAATPLIDLPALADELGVGRVLIKDESVRLGLPRRTRHGADHRDGHGRAELRHAINAELAGAA